MTSRKIENNMTNGNYCDLNCIHCLEEFLDSAGGVDGDFSNDGYFEYYCTLNHPLVFESFVNIMNQDKSSYLLIFEYFKTLILSNYYFRYYPL